MNLAVRPLLLLVGLVLAFAVSLATLLNYFKYEATLKNLQRSSVALAVADVYDTMQKSTTIGLGLAENPALQGLIERQMGASRLILGIDILDETGRIVLSTEVQRVLTMAPAPWIKAVQGSGTNAWPVEDDLAFVIGRTVKNSFNVAVGGVAIRYERDGFEGKLAQMRLYLAGVGAVVLSAAWLCASMVLLVLGGLIRRDFAVAGDTFTGNTPAPSQRHSALAREMLACRAGIEDAERAVAQVVSTMADPAATVPACRAP